MIKANKKQTENIAENIRQELASDVLVSVNMRKTIPKVPDFVMIWQEAIRRVVVGEGLTLITYRVMFFLIGSMEFQNFIGVDIKTIAEDLKVSVPSVDRAMKQLKDIGIVISIKDTFDKRRNAYMLNPLTGWKGKASNYVSAVKKMKNLPVPGQQISLILD